MEIPANNTQIAMYNPYLLMKYFAIYGPTENPK